MLNEKWFLKSGKYTIWEPTSAVELIARYHPEAFLYLMKTFPELLKNENTVRTIIHYLIFYGRFELATELVNQGVNPNHAFTLIDLNNTFVLNFLRLIRIIKKSVATLEKQQTEFLQFLISKGLNVNHIYDMGCSSSSKGLIRRRFSCPLELASSYGQLNTCQLLLEAKADPLLDILAPLELDPYNGEAKADPFLNVPAWLDDKKRTPLIEAFTNHYFGTNTHTAFEILKLMFEKIRERNPDYMLDNLDIVAMNILQIEESSEGTAPEVELYLLSHFVDFNSSKLNIFGLWHWITDKNIPEENIRQLTSLFINNGLNLEKVLELCKSWMEHHKTSSPKPLTARLYDFFHCKQDKKEDWELENEIQSQRIKNFTDFYNAKKQESIAFIRHILYQDHKIANPGPGTTIAEYVYGDLPPSKRKIQEPEEQLVSIKKARFK